MAISDEELLRGVIQQHMAEVPVPSNDEVRNFAVSTGKLLGVLAPRAIVIADEEIRGRDGAIFSSSLFR